MEFVARHRYAYMGIPYFHISVFERTFKLFREACEREGYEADPMQAGWLVPIYVADTDEEARRQYEDHFFYFVKRLLPGINIQPPGYTSVRSLESIMKGAGTFALNLEQLGPGGRGSVRHRGLARHRDRAADREPRAAWARATCSACSSWAPCPLDLTRRNLELFAREVMPRLRKEFPEGAADDADLVGRAVA